MQIGIANGIPLNDVITGDDLVPAYDQSTGTEGYVNLTTAVQKAFSGDIAGTANGVMYLNGSKQVSSGSALTFDGNTLNVVSGAAAVGGGANDRISIQGQSAGTGSLLNSTNAAVTAYAPIAIDGSLTMFRVAGSEQMRLTSTGLGIGVTPSAWAPYRAVQIGQAGSIFSDVGASYMAIGLNTYYDNAATSFKYITSTQATRYDQVVGRHRWYTAPSGTAGNTISFTQAMTLDENGNLLVGTTGFASAGGGTVLQSGATAPNIRTSATATTTWTHAGFYNANGLVGSISTNGSATSYATASDYRLKDNQAPLTNSGSFIDALKPKTWNWKADGTKGVGFIAHEVQEVSPTSVVGEKDAMRVEQYEISPAVPATYDEEGNELTPAVEAVMGEREVPAYQAMEYGSAEFIANIVAELQSLRKRVAVLEAR